VEENLPAGGAGASSASHKGDAKERVPMTSQWTRLSTGAALKCIVVAGAALLLLSAVGCQSPVPREVLQQLPAAQARQLEVYSTNHAYVFDPRLHSLDTCPFLTYLPNQAFMDHSSKEYAVWLHHFFCKKHEEEVDLWRCKCDQELAANPKTISAAKP
jgi:hypothetical protein